MKKVLTIAGSDCSGGAGIQADIKTITVHKMYAMSAITALTAQNTQNVRAIQEVSCEFLESQLDAIFCDIFPDAVKIGMVSNENIIKEIAKKLKEYKAKNIVIDPVMVSTSGSKLISDSAKDILINELFPLGDLITPNIYEASILSGIEISSEANMLEAAKIIYTKIKVPVLIKGGHLKNSSNDLLYNKDETVWFKAKRVENKNTHGTGCTLSSAIACNLADCKTLAQSIQSAKDYISKILVSKLDLGKGSGPLEHTYLLK